jgi:hypothetical protein
LADRQNTGGILGGIVDRLLGMMAMVWCCVQKMFEPSRMKHQFSLVILIAKSSRAKEDQVLSHAEEQSMTTLQRIATADLNDPLALKRKANITFDLSNRTILLLDNISEVYGSAYTHAASYLKLYHL